MSRPWVSKLTQGKDLGNSPAQFCLSQFAHIIEYNGKGLIAVTKPADVTPAALQVLSKAPRDTFQKMTIHF